MAGDHKQRMRHRKITNDARGRCHTENPLLEVHVAVAPRELGPDGRKVLRTLLAANKRLSAAYRLKESFGKLWNHEREGWEFLRELACESQVAVPEALQEVCRDD